MNQEKRRQLAPGMVFQRSPFAIGSEKPAGQPTRIAKLNRKPNWSISMQGKSAKAAMNNLNVQKE